MKKILIAFALLITFGVLTIKSQDTSVLTQRHELKLNLGTSVFMAFPEVSYEYILSEDMSVGGAVGFGFDTNNGDEYNFRVTPFVRWFFGDWFRTMNQPATGLFLEANGAMGTQDIFIYNSLPGSNSNYEVKDKSMFTAGLGLSVGWKYLSKNNWTGELFLGAGRNFIYEKDYETTSIYPRLGISIGKRF